MIYIILKLKLFIPVSMRIAKTWDDFIGSTQDNYLLLIISRRFQNRGSWHYGNCPSRLQTQTHMYTCIQKKNTCQYMHTYMHITRA